MGGKPRNFSQAIDELDDHDHGSNGGAGDMRARLEQELHRIQEMLKNVQPHVEEFSHRVGDEAKKAKARVEDKVTENPWAALGIVGLVFFVLGVVLGLTGGSRRRD